jgi:hypothetical protein
MSVDILDDHAKVAKPKPIEHSKPSVVTMAYGDLIHIANAGRA